jgi:glycosyl transferase family 25
MDAQLRRLGVAYERIPAVDGTKLARQELDRVARRLTAGEIGCILSHQAVWRKIAAADERHAIVLEDDVLLSARFAALAAGDDWIPADADIVKLETTLLPVMVDRRATSVYAGNSLLRLRSGHYGSAAYAVSKQTAVKLLSVKASPVDVLLFDPLHCRRARRVVYQVDPAVSKQDNINPALASLIRPERRQARRGMGNALPSFSAKIGASLRKRMHALLLPLVTDSKMMVRRPIPFSQI